MVVPFLIRRGVVWLLWLLWTGPIVSSSSSSTSASATPLSRRRIAEMYYMYGDEDGTLPYNDDYNPPDGGTSAVELRSPVDDFVPLSCNANLPQATCVRWSVYFGTSAVHNVRLVVRCGDCVTMDFGPSLTLNDGLDIHGKLVFPENYAITLYTAGIVVMGELEMQSTRAPITSTPLIRFVMIAEDENRAFVPIGENAAACGRLALAGSSCVVGKKSITVAGGKMNVHGIPGNAPTWTRLYDVSGGTANNPTQLILQDGSGDIVRTWGVGAKIVITSHTMLWTDQQLRTIQSIASSGENAIITLDAAIRRPTTLVESNDYAVEVALLSRNILFEGGTDLDDGGHMWFFYTPSIVQTIEGLEIRQFGQQGLLGKYPIHFHFCDDVTGSTVTKNTIWQSHQRCVVAHATNNLRIENNVAYDTAGHCFLTESGVETGNYFIRNLGARTRKPATTIPGSQDESDDEPATFWITNPANFVENNVGAGSEDSAFWYELRKRGSMFVNFPDPIYLSLGSFNNNVAHSSVAKTGAIRLYPEGFLPTVSNYAIASGLKAYRNQGSGMFVHRVHNFQIKDALVSDNAAIGIDVDRAEAIDIKDTVIIGKSSEYKALMARDSTIAEICNRNRVIGLDMHTWRLRNEESGAVQVSNVDITGFGDIRCSDRWAISMDPHTLKQGTFELFAKFEGTSIDDAATEINFCRAVQSSEPIRNIYLVDVDGSLRPNGASTGTPATLVSLSSSMTAFVNLQQCTSIQSGCFVYCASTCFRSIRMDVDPTISEALVLRICAQNSPTICADFTGGRRRNGNDPHLNYPRSFFAHLPPGRYVAAFFDQGGRETWPLFVAQFMEEDLCNASPEVTVNNPVVSTGLCSQLVRNGDFSLSSVDPIGWLNDLGGLQLLPGQGSGGKNAISSARVGSGRILQYVDSRCFKAGAKIRVSVKFKLISSQLAAVPCNPGFQQCPKVGIGSGIGSDSTGATVDVAVSNGSADSEGFEQMTGDLDVDSLMASNGSFYVFVEWVEKESSPVKRRIAIDYVSVEVLAQTPLVPTTAPAAQPTVNNPSGCGPSNPFCGIGNIILQLINLIVRIFGGS